MQMEYTSILWHTLHADRFRLKNKYEKAEKIKNDSSKQIENFTRYACYRTHSFFFSTLSRIKKGKKQSPKQNGYHTYNYNITIRTRTIIYYCSI